MCRWPEVYIGSPGARVTYRLLAVQCQCWELNLGLSSRKGANALNL